MKRRWNRAGVMDGIARVRRRIQGSPLAAPLVRHFQPSTSESSAVVPIIDQYVSTAPSAQNAVDVFRGEWSSELPDHLHVATGRVPLFSDARIDVAVDHLGGVAGFDLLELGPLEGGHTWMLCQKGARSVTAVEANRRAYLKCLISKELLGMSPAHFLLGDLLEYLQSSDRHFDAILASGVLYHMQEPIALLQEIGRHTDRLVLWTHYYDPAVLTPAHDQSRLFPGTIPLLGVDGASIEGHRRHYLESLDSQAFCGSGSTWSIWLDRPTILHSLKAMNYSNIRIDMEDPEHPNGPCFLVTAWR